MRREGSDRPLPLEYSNAAQRRGWWSYLLRGIVLAVFAVGAFFLFVVVTEVFANHWEPGVRARMFLRFLLGAD